MPRRFICLFVVTFCAVAPEHPLAAHAAKTNPALATFWLLKPWRKLHAQPKLRFYTDTALRAAHMPVSLAVT